MHDRRRPPSHMCVCKALGEAGWPEWPPKKCNRPPAIRHVESFEVAAAAVKYCLVVPGDGVNGCRQRQERQLSTL